MSKRRWPSLSNAFADVQGKDTACKPAKPGCRRHYVDNYWYVGGYYGACTEDKMKVGLVTNGPIAVGFEVSGLAIQVFLYLTYQLCRYWELLINEARTTYWL